MARKEITITLHVSEMTYEVANKTYLTGRSRYDGQNHERVANMQASEDEENENQIIRSLQSAYAQLKTKLSEYLAAGGTTANNVLMNAKTITVKLLMPSNYNQATVDTIADAMHQYMVNIAVGQWFVITNKEDANEYVSMAAVNLETIREALNKRVRPVRHTDEDDWDYGIDNTGGDTPQQDITPNPDDEGGEGGGGGDSTTKTITSSIEHLTINEDNIDDDGWLVDFDGVFHNDLKSFVLGTNASGLHADIYLISDDKTEVVDKLTAQSTTLPYDMSEYEIDTLWHAYLDGQKLFVVPLESSFATETLTSQYTE